MTAAPSPEESGSSHDGAARTQVEDSPAAEDGPTSHDNDVPRRKGRGWLAIAGLCLATALLSVAQPTLLIFVPLALLFVALPPRRPVTLALAAFIGWLVFGQPAAEGVIWHFERGWALLLGAWFVFVTGIATRWRFLSRALAATAGAAVTATVFMAVSRGGFERLDGAVGSQLQRSAADAIEVWSQARSGAVTEQVRSSVEGAALFQAAVYPALLALASVAALAVAWWAFVRLARRGANPLGTLREFRFRDELVWVLIAGILLLALPLGDVAERAAQNVLLFMAVLYLIRGAAVLIVVVGVAGPVTLIAAALLITLMLPFVMAAAFLVGLSDTWLDIRSRRAAVPGPRS